MGQEGLEGLAQCLVDSLQCLSHLCLVWRGEAERNTSLRVLARTVNEILNLGINNMKISVD